VIPAVAIIGRHDGGKTALVARLIPLFAARGLRVGTVKSAPHLARLDVPGSDSAEHFRAGARRVLLRGERASALFWTHGEASLTSEIERLFADCDLVLVEGGKATAYPKFEVFGRAGDLPEEPLAGEIDVVAVITDERVALPDEVEQFSLHDLEGIADLIEAIAFGASEDD